MKAGKLSFSDLINHVLYGDYTNIEPVKSTRTRSVRELKHGPCYISHRFPFKGGVSWRNVTASNIFANNVLLEKLKLKRKPIT